MKKVISACVDKVLEFDTQEEAAKYIETMRKKKVIRILYRKEINQKCQVRIQEQYNNSPMID